MGQLIALITANEAEDYARGHVTAPKLHKYTPLFEDSEHSTSYLSFYNRASTAMKGVSAVSSAVSLYLVGISKANDTDNSDSSDKLGTYQIAPMFFSGLAFLSTTLDGAWFQKQGSYYQDAPNKLQDFLQQEANTLAAERGLDNTDKEILLTALARVFEVAREKYETDNHYPLPILPLPFDPNPPVVQPNPQANVSKCLVM